MWYRDKSIKMRDKLSLKRKYNTHFNTYSVFYLSTPFLRQINFGGTVAPRFTVSQFTVFPDLPHLFPFPWSPMCKCPKLYCLFFLSPKLHDKSGHDCIATIKSFPWSQNISEQDKIWRGHMANTSFQLDLIVTRICALSYKEMTWQWAWFYPTRRPRNQLHLNFRTLRLLLIEFSC